jgi:hypothetical protein
MRARAGARAGGPGLEGHGRAAVDATKHVNRGCRSLASSGLEWECFLGRAAVDEQIVGRGFLGQYTPAPATASRFASVREGA